MIESEYVDEEAELTPDMIDQMARIARDRALQPGAIKPVMIDGRAYYTLAATEESIEAHGDIIAGPIVPKWIDGKIRLLQHVVDASRATLSVGVGSAVDLGPTADLSPGSVVTATVHTIAQSVREQAQRNYDKWQAKKVVVAEPLFDMKKLKDEMTEAVRQVYAEMDAEAEFMSGSTWTPAQQAAMRAMTIMRDEKALHAVPPCRDEVEATGGAIPGEGGGAPHPLFRALDVMR